MSELDNAYLRPKIENTIKYKVTAIEAPMRLNANLCKQIIKLKPEPCIDEVKDVKKIIDSIIVDSVFRSCLGKTSYQSILNVSKKKESKIKIELEKLGFEVQIKKDEKYNNIIVEWSLDDEGKDK